MPGDLSAVVAELAAAAGRGRVALAVSGGADSLALLLLAQRTAMPERFVVYSVDHRLRPEAAGEVAFVVGIAARFGIFARGLRWNGGKPTTGVQAAARVARYRLMAEAMAADGVTVLMTAHHLRDQAETVLMRMAHGSGIEGLAGMRPVSRIAGVRVERPLLAVHPEALAALVREAGLTPVADPSNTDEHYERVRWRKMVPQLAALGLTEARLMVLSRRMAEAATLVAAGADAAEALVGRADGAVMLDRTGFAGLNPLVQAALMERLLVEASGDDRPVPLGALEALCQRLAGDGLVKPETLHGALVRGGPETISVTREPARRSRKSQVLTAPAS